MEGSLPGTRLKEAVSVLRSRSDGKQFDSETDSAFKGLGTESWVLVISLSVRSNNGH